MFEVYHPDFGASMVDKTTSLNKHFGTNSLPDLLSQLQDGRRCRPIWLCLCLHLFSIFFSLQL